MNAQARRLMGKRRSLQLHAERRLKRALAGCKGCVLVHRVVAMMSPEDSWVAKWQRIGEEVSLVQRLRLGQVVAVIPIDFVVIRFLPTRCQHHYIIIIIIIIFTTTLTSVYAPPASSCGCSLTWSWLLPKNECVFLYLPQVTLSQVCTLFQWRADYLQVCYTDLHWPRPRTHHSFCFQTC